MASPALFRSPNRLQSALLVLTFPHSFVHQTDHRVRCWRWRPVFFSSPNRVQSAQLALAFQPFLVHQTDHRARCCSFHSRPPRHDWRLECVCVCGSVAGIAITHERGRQKETALRIRGQNRGWGRRGEGSRVNTIFQ